MELSPEHITPPAGGKEGGARTDTGGQRDGGFRRSSDSDSKINDFFDGLFRSGPQTRRKTKARRTVKAKGRRGSNMRTGLTLPFTEAMLGTEQSIRIHRNEECDSCNGTGAQRDSPQSTCPNCMGNGEILDQLLRGIRRKINCANAAVEQVSSFTGRVKVVAGQVLPARNVLY